MALPSIKSVPETTEQNDYGYYANWRIARAPKFILKPKDVLAHQRFGKCNANLQLTGRDMKRRLFILLVTSFSTVMLISCSNSGAPSCSDKDVTGTAVDLMSKGLPQQFLYERAAHSECLNRAFSNLDFSQIETLKVDDECVDKELDNARAYVARVRTNGIANLRTTGRDESLKKTTCTGDFAEYHNVQFSAQYTEDGQIYVEIF